MTFRAKLLRGTPIWRLWRAHARAGGNVAGVAFRWAPGDDYVTGDLGADDGARLRRVADVRLETFGSLPAEPAVATARAVSGRPARIPHTPGWRARLRETERGT